MIKQIWSEYNITVIGSHTDVSGALSVFSLCSKEQEFEIGPFPAII